MATAKKEALYIRVEVHFFCNLMVSKMVALKASIVVVNEKNSNENPSVSFHDSDL